MDYWHPQWARGRRLFLNGDLYHPNEGVYKSTLRETRSSLQPAVVIVILGIGNFSMRRIIERIELCVKCVDYF